jgi:hypothetical protein
MTRFLDKYSLKISLVSENNAAVKSFENCNLRLQFIDARESQ